MKFSLNILFIVLFGLSVFGQTSNTLVTKNSVGDVKLGMTIGEARKILPKSYRFDEAGGSEGVVFLGIFDGKTLLMEIGMYYDGRETDKKPPIDEKQKITGITIHDSRYKTAGGVHVGMPIAEAEKQYGKIKEMFNMPHQGEVGKFTNQPEEFNFTFGIKSKDVYTAGIYEEIPDCPPDKYPPLCSIAKRYNQGAFISNITIREPEKKVAQWQIKFEDMPKDLNIALDGPTECRKNSDGEFVGISNYLVWKTIGNSTKYQQISIDRTTLPCVDEYQSRTEVFTNQRYIFYDDFNFDGHNDLALYDGNHGGYSFSSYQIYLYSKTDGKFVHSPSFTELGQYQGMFGINKNRKMIFNNSKSGCCFHQTEGYKIVNNKPVKIYETTTDGTGDNGADDPKVTTKKLINGKWRTWDRDSATRVSFARGKSGKTLSVKLTENEPVKWLKIGAAKGQILRITTNSPNSDINIVDFKGDVSSYDSYVPSPGNKNLFALPGNPLQISPVNERFTAKLLGNGDYYLELSAEEEMTVILTISIKKDDGKIDFSYKVNDKNTSIDTEKERGL